MSDKVYIRCRSAPEKTAAFFSNPSTPLHIDRSVDQFHRPVAAAIPGSQPSHAFHNSIPNSFGEEAVQILLDASQADKMTRNYPVAEFIEAIWGFPVDALRTPPSGYRLARSEVAAYAQGSYEKKCSDVVRHTAYAPLMHIFGNLIAQIKVAMKDAPGFVYNGLAIINNSLVEQSASLKPDFIFGWNTQSLDTSSLATAVVGELKKKVSSQEVKFLANIDVGLLSKPTNKRQCDVAAYDTDGFDASISTVDRVVQMDVVVGSSVHSAASRSVLKRKAISDLERKTQGKRPRLRTAHMNSGKSFLDPSATDPKIEEHELRLVYHLNELGAHGIRSYTTGFLVDDYKMSLWYIDHMGLIKCASFDWLKEPHYLVHFLASIIYADFSKLGFFPLLKFPGQVGSVRTTEFQDATLDLPHALGAEIDNRTLGNVNFCLDVKTDRRHVWADDLVGRSTVLIPVEANPCDTTATALCGQDSVVAKISWPLDSVAREPEDAYIRVIRTRLRSNHATKKFLANVVDLKCSASLSLRDLDVPRAKMTFLENLGLPAGSRRLCRILVMKEYLSLASVTGPEEFKVVFVDVVRAHHAIHTATDILHRDISMDNIMFHYVPDSSRENGQRAVGVLCDFDLAKTSPEPSVDHILKNLLQSDPRIAHISAAIDTAEQGQPMYRTGTGPFMALDILEYYQPPAHLYRHDLESFFWVLAWFIIAYDSKTKKVRSIEQWCNNDYATVAREKASFLDRPYTLLENVANEEYKALWDTWGRKLSILFKKLHFQYITFLTLFMGRFECLWDAEFYTEQTGFGFEAMKVMDRSVEDVLKDLRNFVAEREQIVT